MYNNLISCSQTHNCVSSVVHMVGVDSLRAANCFSVYIFLTPSGTETSSNLHQKLCYHVLGTDQSEDILCAEFPDEPKWMGGAEVLYYGKMLPKKLCLMDCVCKYPCFLMTSVNGRSPLRECFFFLLKTLAFKLTLTNGDDKPFNCNCSVKVLLLKVMRASGGKRTSAEPRKA